LCFLRDLWSSKFLLLLLVVPRVCSAYGQETVFEVPSVDILDKGKIYGELDGTFRFSDSLATFTPRVVVGIGAHVEVEKLPYRKIVSATRKKVVGCLADRHRNFDMIRIIVVDDHIPTRKLIRQLLEQHENWKVVAERSDGHEAIEHAKKHEPHVVILDIQMPKTDGFEATRQILKTFPPMQILIISIHDGSHFAEASTSASAKGFLYKLRLPNKLIAALEAILNGASQFPGDMAATA
jgi:CheY-like chemotaxis protein